MKALISLLVTLEVLYDDLSQLIYDKDFGKKYISKRKQAEDFLTENGIKFEPFRFNEGFSFLNTLYSYEQTLYTELGKKCFNQRRVLDAIADRL